MLRDSTFWHPFAPMGSVRHDELVLTEGDDVWVVDEDGRRYLDGTAALWYANVGHGRAEIVDAIVEQASRLAAYSAFGDFANRPALELCDRLAALAPGDGWRVFLASGGGDGVDTALKLARRYHAAVGDPQRTHVISRSCGYHGTRGWGTAVSAIPVDREGFGPAIAETTQVPHDSLDALAAAFEAIGPERVAAVIVEPVIGAGGLHPPPRGYLKGVEALCRRDGALFVADAVICGFGRLGTWFGVERFRLRPDLIVFAKGVTSGYLPLGGVMVSARVAEPFFAPDGPVLRHGTTYAGHPTCCAAALANVRILEREGLLDRAVAMEGPLAAALGDLLDHPLVKGMRGGVGLLGAVVLDPEVIAQRPSLVQDVFRGARSRGVIVRPLTDALAVSPPLTVTHTHIELLVDALRGALDDVHHEVGGRRPLMHTSHRSAG
jgi:adenosylmethionine-8-amino-7-oxononanoate aminotransferase